MSLGGYMMYSDWSFRSQTEQTTGMVVGVRSHLGGKGSRSFAPEVTFTTAASQVITFTNPVYYSGADYRVGDTIVVHYPLTEPEGARISVPRFGFPLWSFVFGLVFFILSVIGLRQRNVAQTQR